MNTVTAVAPVITAGNDALKRDFPLKPFAHPPQAASAIRC